MHVPLLMPRSGRTEALRAMLITIVAHVSEAQSSISGGFESWRDHATPPIPNRTRCPANSTGNGAIKSLTARDAGCLPPRMASLRGCESAVAFLGLARWTVPATLM